MHFVYINAVHTFLTLLLYINKNIENKTNAVDEKIRTDLNETSRIEEVASEVTEIAPYLYADVGPNQHQLKLIQR